MRYIRYKYSNKIEYGILLKNESIQPVDQMSFSVDEYNEIRNGPPISLRDVELLSPCQPGKIIATAINYPGATGLTESLDQPLVFIKPSSSVIGPNQTII